MYIAAWAAPDVTTLELHPPYNLFLRLLIELCSDIVVLPGPVCVAEPGCGNAAALAARTFDPEALPCSTGTGYTSDCKVVMQTASNTEVQVRLRVLHARCRHNEGRQTVRGVQACLAAGPCAGAASTCSLHGSELLALRRAQKSNAVPDAL